MSKKIKKISLLFTFFTSLLVAPFIVSLSTPKLDVSLNKKSKNISGIDELKKELQNSYKNNSFDNFIKQSAISNLIDLVYTDKKEKEKFILSQKNINNNYQNFINTIFRYSNNIVDGYLSSKQTYLNAKARKIREEMNEVNWLWALYNIPNFSFTQYSSNNDDLTATRDETILKNSENKRLYNYQITNISNKIIDYSFVKKIDENDNGYKVYFLTDQGFIIKLDISLPNESRKTVKISWDDYLRSYPKLLKSPDPKNDFSIVRYASIKIETNRKYIDDKIDFEENWGSLIEYIIS